MSWKPVLWIAALLLMGACSSDDDGPRASEVEGGGNSAVCAAVDDLNDRIQEALNEPSPADGFAAVQGIDAEAAELGDLARSTGASDELVELSDALGNASLLDTDPTEPFLRAMTDLNNACK